MNKFSQTLVRWLRSRQFFMIVMVFFVLEAVWIALSARYPMAFDEDFHLGIIQLYAHHLSPFFSGQPAGADTFGAVARDPSYLYHYLMSFPWRVITMLTHNFTTQVILMRFINVGLFASSLVLFRKLLRQTSASPALVNMVLLFFVLTPIVPLVAAQINYDNLLMPLAALSLLLTQRFVRTLQKHKEVDYVILASLLIVCLLASLVKYAFLPIFVAIFFYVCYQLYAQLGTPKRRLWQHIISGYKKIVPSTGLLLIGLIVISSGLFIERYGINMVRYETPIPECNQVLSVKQCTSYGAWNRNYLFSLNKVGKTDWNPLSFSLLWARKLAFNLMFGLNGIESGFAIGKPLPLPRITARAVAYVGLPLVLLYGVKILQDKTLRWLLLVIIFYLSALWIQNYSDYLHLGQQVAVQGRYLLPVLPFIYVMIGLAFSHVLHSKTELKLLLAGVATFCLLLGGGALTFILHSDDTWYWQNQHVINANQALQHVLDPLIVGSRYIQS